MYALLLLLGLSFFFIFFLFSKLPDFNWYFVGSLFLEANLYILFSLLSCLVVYKHSLSSKKIIDSTDAHSKFWEFIPSSGEIKDFFIDFFSNYIYYIAGILFYCAIYLITRSFSPELDIAYIFLVFNIIVFSLYFFPKSLTLGKDLIIINLVLISLYYIWEHILYLFYSTQIFSSIDIINIFAVFILFCITLFNEEYGAYRKVIEQYFIIFLFLELSTLYKWIFSWDISSLGIIAGILGSFLLIFTDYIKKYFFISKYASRTWGLLFGGISVVIYAILVIFQSEQFIMYSIGVFCISILMLLFHKRFCSYFALSAWAIWISSFWHFLYMLLLQGTYGNTYLFIIYFFLSFLFIYILRKLQTFYDFDRYFFRIISVLVNLIWVITFLFFNEISILAVWLLLLWESVYLFFIYYSLRKNNS
jgi:hypothetical protein